MYSTAFTRTRSVRVPQLGPLRVILRHFKTIQSYIYKVIFNVMICMQLKMFKVLQSIIILSMIYARTTTFSIKFILGKMKFPVFSLIFLLIFKFPVFSLILNKIFKFPDFSLQGIFFSHFPCFPCFSLSVGTLPFWA